MKILMIVHQFLPGHSGGTELHTYHVCRSLIREGHSIRLFFAESDVEKLHGAVSEGTFENIRYTAVNNLHPGLSYLKSYQFEPAERACADILRDFLPDIVHIQHLQNLSHKLPEIIKNASIPVVFTLHDFSFECLAGGQRLLGNNRLCKTPSLYNCSDCLLYSPYVFRGHSPLRVMRTAFWRLQNFWTRITGHKPMRSVVLQEVQHRQAVMTDALRQIDSFIAPSKFIMNEFLKYGISEDKITYLPHAIDPVSAGNLTADSSPGLKFGFIGSINPQKGLHVLLEAFDSLDRRKNVRLHIYGAFGGFEKYNRKIKKFLKTTNKIKWFGEFEHQKLSEILGSIDILVVPSIWYENAPLVMQEAFLHHVPVLASDCGGMYESLERTGKGWLFERNKAPGLRAKLDYLIEHPEEIRRIKEAECVLPDPALYLKKLLAVYSASTAPVSDHAPDAYLTEK